MEMNRWKEAMMASERLGLGVVPKYVSADVRDCEGMVADIDLQSRLECNSSRLAKRSFD